MKKNKCVECERRKYCNTMDKTRETPCKDFKAVSTEDTNTEKK